MVERRLALIKPEGMKYREIIRDEILRNGFVIVAERQFCLTPQMAESLYEEHQNKPWFHSSLIPRMTSAELIAMVLERENAIAEWRTLMGERDLSKRNPESIRGRFGHTTTVVHGSNSPEAARREIAVLFAGLL